MKPYNVLSLFGGMECGRLALEKENIPVGKYYSSEIDKYAIQISNKNYPDIIPLGDVTKWREWDIDFSSIDLLLAGFPCQAWSNAGKQKGDSDPRGALVHDLIDIWNEIKKHNPNVKFLFENVKMKKEFLDYVNNLFGVEPICINSALVSAQNRVRYYWTNIPGVTQPEDRKIFLKDVLEDVGIDITKQFLSKIPGTATYKKSREALREITEKARCLSADGQHIKNSSATNIIIREKAKCVRSGGRDSYDRHEWDSVDKYHIRKLTVKECERLQTLPDNYTAGVSDTQRYKMIGNGWTVEVIAHILKGLKQ